MIMFLCKVPFIDRVFNETPVFFQPAPPMRTMPVFLCGRISVAAMIRCKLYAGSCCAVGRA